MSFNENPTCPGCGIQQSTLNSAGLCTPCTVQREAERRGYRIEQSTDGREARVIRPDGTTAIIARKDE